MKATKNQIARADDFRKTSCKKIEEKEISFERCDTDGFLSQWSSQKSSELDNAKAVILENGGYAKFERLVTNNDEPVNAKMINGKYGLCWALLNDNGDFTGQFLGTSEKALLKHGLKEIFVERPAWACYAAPNGATGLSGCSSVYVKVFEIDKPKFVEGVQFRSNGAIYVVEKASKVAQKIGRPRNRMAQFELLVRRQNGKRLYQSYLYNDGTFCQPF